MKLPPRDLEFLRGVATENKFTKRLGPVAREYARDHGIGCLHGANVVYTDADFQKAADFLRNRGYPLQTPESGLARDQTPRGGSEKTGAARVLEGFVAAVPLNMGVQLPGGSSFIGMHWPTMDLAGIEVVLEVENLQVLTKLSMFSWLADFTHGRRTLAVFRGMPGIFGTQARSQLLAACGKPVLGFYDFDPAGLAMAATERNLEALCLPPWDLLEASVRYWNREHLFFDQVESRRTQLDAVDPAHPVHAAWQRLLGLKCGLNQEHFPR